MHSVKFTLLDTDNDNSNIWEMFCINQDPPEKQDQEGTFIYIYINI